MRGLWWTYACALSGCFNPTYNHPTCGPNDECPSGLHCDNGHCVGTAPSDAPGDEAVGDDAGDAPLDAPLDAPIDAAPLTCDRSDILFCEDFEDVPAGTPTTNSAWMVQTQGSQAMTIDGIHAMGAHALHVQLPPSTGFASGLIRKNMTLPNNSAYIRYRLYVVALAGAGVHTGFSQAAGVEGFVHLGDTQNLRWMTNGFIQSANAEWFRSQQGVTPIPMNQFLCLEYFFNGTLSELRVWIDGVPRDDLTANDGTVSWTGGAQMLQFPLVQRLVFGTNRYQSSSNVSEVWIDDIVVATNPIGCAP